jgi:HD-like signal output (HDOD) protein
LSRQIGSLREAVAILGFGCLRGMVLSVGLIGAFSAADEARRSLVAAVTATTLANGLGLERNTPPVFDAELVQRLGLATPAAESALAAAEQAGRTQFEQT